MLRRVVRGSLNRLQKWLEEEVVEQEAPDPNKEEFIHTWLNSVFAEMAREGMRRSYAWGVLQGANLGKALGLKRVSVLEFGVAGGNGLVALERIAACVEEALESRGSVRDAVATGFLEAVSHRADEAPSSVERIVHHLGPRAVEYIRGWDHFTAS